MFVQCMMPDDSERIRKTTVMTMLDLLLILSVFNPKTSLEDIAKNHPLISVVFNNVSKSQDPEKSEQRIQKYRSLLEEKACEIYCTKFSDSTEVAGMKWKEIKKEILGTSDYYQ